MSASGSGLPSESKTRPSTMILSPSGSPSCWRVRSWSNGPTFSCPYTGPVISDSVWGNGTSGRLGARRTVERYSGCR